MNEYRKTIIFLFTALFIMVSGVCWIVLSITNKCATIDDETSSANINIAENRNIDDFAAENDMGKADDDSTYYYGRYCIWLTSSMYKRGEELRPSDVLSLVQKHASGSDAFTNESRLSIALNDMAADPNAHLQQICHYPYMGFVLLYKAEGSTATYDNQTRIDRESNVDGQDTYHERLVLIAGHDKFDTEDYRVLDFYDSLDYMDGAPCSTRWNGTEFNRVCDIGDADTSYRLEINWDYLNNSATKHYVLHSEL